MILKKIIGKTLEAARESARQMYGDDFVILESFQAEEDKDAGITVVVDKNHKKGSLPSGSGDQKSADGGVRFEPSNKRRNQLDSLRKYAHEQDAKLNKEEGTTANSSKATPFEPGILNGKSTTNNSNSLYSRANIRKDLPQEISSSEAENDSSPNEHKSSGKTGFKPSSSSIYSRFDESKPKIKASVSTPSVSTQRRNEREITALHKRFDKLEALLDSALISTNLEYASHPLFQQLVQTGIHTSVTARWFSEIVDMGIDPFQQPEQFTNQMGELIRTAIDTSVSADVQKFIMFAGSAGAGKSSLIMKLVSSDNYFKGQNIAVLSLLPNDQEFYYTMLDPFCKDHGIPYYTAKTGVEVTTLQPDFETYDHVLIDTPGIDIQQSNSFRHYWKLRQMLASCTPLEVHYVVNASQGQYFFEEASASHHPMQPDYLAITNLDQVSKWGGLIPFLKSMNCGTRYVSMSRQISNGASTFKAENFAKKVLEHA